jgi:tRNA (cmo5U34)-methyltransferase
MDKKLERMDDFFNNVAETYDSHMLNDMCLKEFYDEFQKHLPCNDEKLSFVDLGCGTGLEIERILKNYPNAEITGIDLSENMLQLLKQKFSDNREQLNIVCKSYFDFDFGDGRYDYAVSTYSLHHFNVDEKLTLYKRVYNGLKDNGVFINGDYVVDSSEKEQFFRSENIRIRKENEISDGFYHYDTPLFFGTEKELLFKAGFKSVEIVKQWENTTIFMCYKLENTT